MIPHRFARILGAVLLLAPSLALGQAALQQPCTDRTRGCAVMNLPAAADLLYRNDLYLQGLIGTRFGQLGSAAFLGVGTTTGTVADGGALTAEVARAKAAEQANATAIQTNATAIATETSRAQGVEALKAPIASPAFTGAPTVPTAALGTSTTQAASTAFVANAVAAGGGGGSSGVPTSRQILASGLATGGGDLTADRTITVPAAAQADVATGTDTTKALTSFSVAAALAAKAPLASPAFVGNPTAPTAAAGTNSTTIASTAFVATSYAPLASPTLTGTPNAPTQAANDNSTKIASTAYADRAASNAATAVAQTSGAVVNSARAQSSALATTATQTLISDAVPTTSNTTLITGLSATITPRAATNKLRVRAVVQGSSSVLGAFVAAIFQGSGTNAVATNYISIPGANYNGQVEVTFEVVAGGTSPITFAVGVGSNNSGTLTINGSSGSRLFGGTSYSSIEVTETLP